MARINLLPWRDELSLERNEKKNLLRCVLLLP